MNNITPKQLEANRQNAKLGGVKTKEGKAVSRYNALKHGILSQEVLLNGEDEQPLIELSRRLRTELKPGTEFELILVDRIVANTWRLKRALRGEKEMIEHDMSDPFGSDKNFGSALSSDFAKSDSYGKFTRYETCLEKGIYKALHELQRQQTIRKVGKTTIPTTADIDISNE